MERNALINSLQDMKLMSRPGMGIGQAGKALDLTRE